MTTTSLLRVRIRRRADEAADITSFELVAADGGELPAFDAGAHLDVHVPAGPVRPYSLCNDPTERHRYLIAVLKDPASRGGSAGLHERVREGDVLEVGVPRNHFPLAAAPHSLLLAGGIGVTPILCMAERLGRSGASFAMHYCARAPERMAFRERLQRASYAARVAFHFDDGEPAQRLDLPALLAAQPAGTHLYVCGPKGFMDAVLGAARGSGWPEPRLHHEFFGAAPVGRPADRGFDLRLARSGRVVRVAGDQTVLQALAEAGVSLPTSCEQGVCGTCLTTVLAGEPDHRDLYLTPEEQAANDRFLPCCSRSRSPELVLDL